MLINPKDKPRCWAGLKGEIIHDKFEVPGE